MNKLKLTRSHKDKIHGLWMVFWVIIILIIPALLGVGLVLKSALLLKGNNFFQLLCSNEWKPLSGLFGLAPFILSSLWVTVLAVVIAGPVCLLSAIHLTQYANRFVLKIMQPVIDILAGLPSVIYGVWGILVIVPFVSGIVAPAFGIHTSGYTILSGSLVLAIMIIPFILNILIDIFNSIPLELQEASLSLGASRWYTIKYVLVRKAFPGIISAFGLGVSRAFGETIAVLMVVGNVVAIPNGIFDAGYPLPALIANNYGEMLSIPLYDSALMMAALVLFIIVMLFNLVSRILVIRYEKIYA